MITALNMTRGISCRGPNRRRKAFRLPATPLGSNTALGGNSNSNLCDPFGVFVILWTRLTAPVMSDPEGVAEICQNKGERSDPEGVAGICKK